MRTWLTRLRAPVIDAVAWLGAATLAWSAALALEIAVRAISSDAGDAAIYVGSLAIAAGVVWSMAVAIFQVALRAAERYGWRGLAALLIALTVVVAPRVNTLADVLVEGDFIARQSYVEAVRVALLVSLLGGWHALWLWHAWGTSPGLRSRWCTALGSRGCAAIDLAFWTLGIAALAAIFVLLGGLLRPYLPMAEALLFPSWLLAATLAFRGLRALRGRPALVSGAALAGVVIAGALFALRASDPRRGAATRSAALGNAGWIALTEARFSPLDDEAVGRFDFASAAASKKACPAPRTLPPLALPAARRRNVILLSIDTMRRDAIGKRFGARAVAPHLEQFAAESVFFGRATAAAPGTLYSIGSLLTGQSIDQLLWQRALPKTVFTRTRKLFDDQRMFLPDWSTIRGGPFKRLIRQQTPTQLIKRKTDPAEPFIQALDAARAEDQRVFFWLHLVDAHHPYGAHAKFDFGDSPYARYYGEIAFDDALLGRVLEHLRQGGWLDDSLIVIFSDHGESLGEGGYFGHGISMRGRFTDVPLYVHAPGLPARISNAPVMLTQVAPTILHFLDRSIDAAIAGCSLLAPESELQRCALPVSGVHGLRGEVLKSVLDTPLHTLADLERRQTEIERWRRFAPELTATSSDHRYVLDLRTGADRLYQRAQDPNEKHDLTAARPDLVRDFRTRIATWRRDEAQRIACDVLR